MNIILIDDEAVALNALKRRMDWAKYGFEQVFTANSMPQAQQLFAQKRIEVMLCDIEMPWGSGLELFEWVKAHYPAVECVFITCHPEYEYMRKALQLGSDALASFTYASDSSLCRDSRCSLSAR